MAQDLYNQGGFDGQAYLAQNQDVVDAGMDPWTHYDLYGRSEGRQYTDMAPTPTSTTTTTPSGATTIQQYTSDQIQNPVLPVGAVQAVTPQAVQGNELQTAQNDLTPTLYTAVAPTAQQTLAVAPAPVVAAQGTSQAVDPNQPLAGVSQNGVAANATFTSPTQQAEAAQGTVSSQSTVQGQLEQLMDFGPGDTPAWAKGAIAKAKDLLAARGLGNSTIAGSAITQAVMQNALPIAAQDASTYFQMDVKNLDNRQQAMLTNVQMAQQNMLTDTAIANANSQFNATNQQQSQQFVASLISSITQQNAARVDAMTQLNVQQKNAIATANQQTEAQTSQFNAGQANSIAVANAQLQSTMDQFNSQLANNREQFNSTQRAAVDQSNTLWRRTVNTANTAAQNAANATNVQNLFNMSQVAQNDLWQQWRDEASWNFTSAQTAATMDFNSAMAANNRNFIGDQNDSAQNNAMLATAAATFANFLR